MNRLAFFFAACALVLACAPKPEELPIDPGGPISGSGGGGGGPSDGGEADAGADAGTDGGAEVTCNPLNSPSDCAAGTYCGCRDPAGAGSSCVCVTGSFADPCPSGSARCQAPGICRWGNGFLWGKCGPQVGVSGDVCELGSFFCEAGLSCVSGCAWGRCCG